MNAPNPQTGLTGLKSTNKGLIFLLAAAVAVGLMWGVAGYVQNVQASKKQWETWSSFRWLNTALHNYHATHQRFPAQLETLLDPQDGYPPLLMARHLAFPGYRLKYVPTPTGYMMRLTPDDPEGVHFYTDQTVVIRFRRAAAADAGSPEWREQSGP